jgi:hypothetical protein
MTETPRDRASEPSRVPGAYENAKLVRESLTGMKDWGFRTYRPIDESGEEGNIGLITKTSHPIDPSFWGKHSKLNEYGLPANPEVGDKQEMIRKTAEESAMSKTFGIKPKIRGKHAKQDYDPQADIAGM